MIYVVNKHTHSPTDSDYYIGRGSSLGNIFSHLPHSKAEFKVANLDQAIKEYRAWFYEQIKKGNPKILDALHDIKDILNSTGTANLVCFCWPKKCHGEIIRSFLIQKECPTCSMLSSNECMDPNTCFDLPSPEMNKKQHPSKQMKFLF